MTQAFNLSQLANKVNSSGQLDGSTGLTSPVVSNTIGSSASTALTLQSAGTTAITVDTSQNVGIGTASPARRLHVRAGGVTTLANTNGALFTDASNAGVLLGSDNVLGYVQGVTVAGTATVNLVLQPFGDNMMVGTTSNSANAKLKVSRAGNRATIEAEQTDSGGYNFQSIAFNNSGTYYHCNFQEGATQRGSITSNGALTTYNTGSDYRLKNDITPMTGALNKVSSLKPVTWKWKSNGSEGQGFLAHELYEICPEAVTGTKDAIDENGKPVYQMVDVSCLIATLTKAIQELKTINDTQAETINALTARIVALETK